MYLYISRSKTKTWFERVALEPKLECSLLKIGNKQRTLARLRERGFCLDIVVA